MDGRCHVELSEGPGDPVALPQLGFRLQHRCPGRLRRRLPARIPQADQDRASVEHYTAAMVVMVRELGLPARIAVGFRPGTQQEDGGYLVQTGDAHVWVEVLFPGYG
ncbi:MAG: transglutaminase-like domain-containing protein [Actinomycetota bacterium]